MSRVSNELLLKEYSIRGIKRFKGKKGQLLSMVSLISLSACGGGTSPSPAQPSVPTPTPTPDFTESPTGTFTAKDDTNLTLDQSSATTDLIVNSKAGDDSITTGSGADTIVAGDGNDTVNAGSGANDVRGGEGNDSITTGSDNDTIDGGAGDDTIIAGDGSNIITTGNGTNSVTTGSGDDIITGGSGVDTIVAGDGANTILGGDGVDTITGGSGVDMIRGGHGADIIDAGAGDDVIVVVGSTGANEYSDADITDPGGSGLDLSSLITLADLNGQTVSEGSFGEVIDGGSGADTLVIYGVVDLQGISIQNVTTLQVNSVVTLSPEQLAQFTTVNGDGESVINIVDDPDDDVVFEVDLSAIDLSDVATITTTGDVQVVISNADDLAGVDSIEGDGNLTLVVAADSTGEASTVTTSDLAATVSGAGELQVDENVTLAVDDTTSLDALGAASVSGDGGVAVETESGTVDLSGVSMDGLATLAVSSDVTMDAAQINQVAAISGDGTSTINLVDNAEDGVSSQVDLSTASISDIGTITTTGDVELTVSSADDMAGIGSIAGDGDLSVVIVDDGTGSNEITTTDLSDTLSGVDSIEVEDTATLVVDDTASLDTLGVSDLGGEGDIAVDSTTADTSTLDGITLDDDVTIVDESGTVVDETDVGAVVVADPELSIGDISVTEDLGEATFTVTMSKVSDSNVNVDYVLSDGTGGTLSIAAGETSATISVFWEDDNLNGDNEEITATLSNSINADIAVAEGTLTILDDEGGLTMSFGQAFQMTETLGDDLNAQWEADISVVEPQLEMLDTLFSGWSHLDDISGEILSIGSSQIVFTIGGVSEDVYGDGSYIVDHPLYTVTVDGNFTSTAVTLSELMDSLDDTFQGTVSGITIETDGVDILAATISETGAEIHVFGEDENVLDVNIEGDIPGNIGVLRDIFSGQGENPDTEISLSHIDISVNAIEIASFDYSETSVRVAFGDYVLEAEGNFLASKSQVLSLSSYANIISGDVSGIEMGITSATFMRTTDADGNALGEDAGLIFHMDISGREPVQLSDLIVYEVDPETGRSSWAFNEDASLGQHILDTSLLGGSDTLDFSAMTEGVGLNLDNSTFNQFNLGAHGAFELSGSDVIVEVENIIGSQADDAIQGSSTANNISGGAGNDILKGAGGDDVLEGGAGNDILMGGEGDDTFVFGQAWGEDAIAGVESGDKYDFSDAGFAFSDFTIEVIDGDTIISAGDNSVLLNNVEGTFENIGTEAAPVLIFTATSQDFMGDGTVDFSDVHIDSTMYADYFTAGYFSDDDMSGITSFNLLFENTDSVDLPADFNGEGTGKGILWAALNQDGYFGFWMTDGQVAGDYNLYRAVIRDAAGNRLDLDSMVEFVEWNIPTLTTVINHNSDTSQPELLSMEILDSSIGSIDPVTGVIDTTISVRFIMSGDSTDLPWAYAHYEATDGSGSTFSFEGAEFYETRILEDGTIEYIATTEVSANLAEGTYTIDWLSYWDSNFDYEARSVEEVTASGQQLTFTLTNEGTSDNTLPTLTNLTLDAEDYNPGDVIQFSSTASDDLSGVARLIVWFEAEAGQQFSVELFDEDGDGLFTGSYTLDNLQASGTYDVARILLIDEAGNRTDLNAEEGFDFSTLGLSTGFNVSYPIDVTGEYIVGQPDVALRDGSDENDYIVANGATGSLNGGFGDDTLIGDDFDNNFRSEYGDDRYTTGGGADFLWGSFAGHDTITDFNPSEGDSYLIYGDHLSGGTSEGVFTVADLDIIDTADGALLTFGPDHSVLFEGWTAADLRASGGITFPDIVGSDGDDILVAPQGSGSDIVGGDGNDTLVADSDNFTYLLGGAGNDTFDANNAAAVFFDGGAGNDTFHGGTGNRDFVDYEENPSGITADFLNNTILDGYGGTDTVDSAIDAIQGSHFDDVITTSANITRVYSKSGDDTIVQGEANANGLRVYLHGGNDSFTGIAGGDVLVYATEGDDIIDSTAGSATVSYSTLIGNGQQWGVKVNLAEGWVHEADGSSDTLIAVENIVGSWLNDHIVGDAGNNSITGFYGDDHMEGGAGSDVFVFDRSANGNDHISDFEHGVDLLDFRGSGWDFDDLYISYNEDGAEIYYGNSSIFLEGVAEGVLTEGDFIFPTSYYGYLAGHETITDFNPDGGDTYYINGNHLSGGTPEGVFTADDLDIIDTVDGALLTFGPDHTVLFEGWSAADLRSSGSITFPDIIGSDGDDILIAPLDSNASVVGGAGNDTLEADANGSSFLYGGLGDDTLIANDAPNYTILDGGMGNDLIIGGAGTLDLVDYEENPSAITADFLSNTILDGYGGTDTVDGAIEGIFGSHFNDMITTSANITRVYANSGDDTIVQGEANANGLRVYLDGGNDSFTGIAGGDVLVYATEGDDIIDSTAGLAAVSYAHIKESDQQWGVEVNLAEGWAHEADGSSDTLIAVENIVGSQVNDHIVGDAGDNNITGYYGDDYMEGGAGSDVFVFDRAFNGNDRIGDFEDGVDLLDFSLSSWSFEDMTISYNEGGAEIVYGDSVIELDGLVSGSLTQDDFIF